MFLVRDAAGEARVAAYLRQQSLDGVIVMSPPTTTSRSSLLIEGFRSSCSGTPIRGRTLRVGPEEHGVGVIAVEHLLRPGGGAP